MKKMLFLPLACMWLTACKVSKKTNDHSKPIAMVQTNLSGIWQLNYISGINETFEDLYPGRKPTLMFNLDQHQASGNSSCNSYSAMIKTEGHKISFGDAVATMMACPGRGEQVYLKTLKSITSYSTGIDSSLTLIMGDIAVMRFSKLPAPETQDAHNSRQSLDWPGTYHGTLPCSDCEGIEMVITLNQSLTYKMWTRHLGKKDIPAETSGTFLWNKDGNSIVFQEKSKTMSFQVGEQKLTQLDQKGNKINGVLAERYNLAKEISGNITGKYWKLVEIMGNPIPKTDNREAHIILRAADKRFNGTGGCNLFNGFYTLKETGKISFSPAATTEMACPGMETEQRLLKVLETADSYILKGEDTLILNRARMAPLARFEAVYLR